MWQALFRRIFASLAPPLSAHSPLIQPVAFVPPPHSHLPSTSPSVRFSEIAPPLERGRRDGPSAAPHPLPVDGRLGDERGR